MRTLDQWRAGLLRFRQLMPRHTGDPVACVIRLKGDAIIQADTFRGRLSNYPRPRGRIRFLNRVRYRQDGAVAANPVWYWARGHRERWYPATSLADPRPAGRMYRRRMPPEQYFQDGKQRFGLDRSAVTTTAGGNGCWRRRCGPAAC